MSVHEFVVFVANEFVDHHNHNDFGLVNMLRRRRNIVCENYESGVKVQDPQNNSHSLPLHPLTMVFPKCQEQLEESNTLNSISLAPPLLA
mmetsp:Transcript_16898/g.28782  ORF Transcript_16898/g.28782 Transcript_16898/m.28782 type:complete len:90 (+) Transcript_16898:23-292(+)